VQHKYDIDIIDLGLPRPTSARILVAQPRWQSQDWFVKHGLSFLRNPIVAENWISHVLSRATETVVDMVLFPELSVPEESLSQIQAWSKQTGAIVIGGSHYFRRPSGYVSRCPVIIAGSAYFVEKITPAPIEVSPIKSQGLQSGERLLVFKNSSIGNFGVLICSDYLNTETKDAVIEVGLDILCVPAFQRISKDYHVRMSLDCENSQDGLYIAYANTLLPGVGDGKSAIFALMDSIFSEKLKTESLTDGDPRYKLFEFHDETSSAVFEFDLKYRRPYLKRNVQSRPNVNVLEITGDLNSKTEQFGDAIGRQDKRYSQIRDFFVPSIEFPHMLEILEQSRILFIVGDPGLGKTYTAIYLLWLYFERGYQPIWFGGLEREDRLKQRTILENFQPKNAQVIYFEDPFGRTRFENRDSIRRVFVPLTERLTDLDARVIITCRREIFEQFTTEVVPALALERFTQDMNVVKPSYPTSNLNQILERHATGSAWFRDQTLRDLVKKQLTSGRIWSPLAIRDFVFSSESVQTGQELLARLKTREGEETSLFAEEIQAVTLNAKLTLGLVLLFGRRSVADLCAWYNGIGAFVDPTQTWSGTSPFFAQIRAQLGFRIEQYGPLHGGMLRFLHPRYEEAFVIVAERDPLTSDILISTIKYVARLDFQHTARIAGRVAERYPNLGRKLLNALLPVLENSRRLSNCIDMLQEFFATYIKENNEDILHTLRTELPAIIPLINKEFDGSEIARGLRFLIQVDRGLRPYLKLDMQTLDWKQIEARWLSENSFEHVVNGLWWARFIDDNIVKTFSENIPKIELVARAKTLNAAAFNRYCHLLKEAGSSSARFILPFRPKAMMGQPSWKKAVTQELANFAELTGKSIVIDFGAHIALKKGYNLLPVGVIEVIGEFDARDLVDIFSETGQKIGAGLVSYSDVDTRLIRGHHSRDISNIVVEYRGAPVIRHDSLVLLMEVH
jgi:predicted amidohydrolase